LHTRAKEQKRDLQSAEEKKKKKKMVDEKQEGRG